MADKDNLSVAGYRFGSNDDVQAALKELKNAQYLEERVSTMSVKQMVSVYNKMLDEKVFRTPVGWEYLKYLQNRITDADSSIEVRPIPLYVTLTSQSKPDKSMEHIAKMYVKNRHDNATKTAENLKLSVAFNVLLAILVIVLFAITIKAPTPNMINYKSAINNQYATWEQELTERENAVREKELKLENIGSR